MPTRKDRADSLIRAAEACEGVLDMTLAQVVVPHVHRTILSRLLQRLVHDGVLADTWMSFGQYKVWLTTSARKGYRPGIRFLHASVMEGEKDTRRTTRRRGYARYDGWDMPRAYLPNVVYHALMAATLSFGFGAYATTLDAEIGRGEAGEKIPDGVAWITPHDCLRIEVERLLGRTPRDWYKDNGIAETVCAFAARHHRDRTEAQHLIATDAKYKQALVTAINTIAKTHGFDAAAGEKWWWVPIENICANPLEFTIGQTSPTGSRPGIRTMQVDDPVRRGQQLQDKVIKAAKAEQRRAEQSALARRLAQLPSAPPTPTAQHDDRPTIPHEP